MTLRSISSAFVMAAWLFSGCASGSKAAAASADPRVRQGAVKKSSRHPETESIGPDVIVAAGPEDVWPYIAEVEDWGSWCSRVTKVEPGAGLSPGAEIKWQWEEKEVLSTIVSVKENEEFSMRACASSKKAILHWKLQARPDGGTLINLRAEVPYGTASETMGKLGIEMSEWITALQDAVNKD